MALQAFMAHPDNEDQPFYLKHEKVDALPQTLSLSKNATHNIQNVILHRIELPTELRKAGEEHVIQVNEYHKGRREPYPKVIRVYEK